MHYIQSTRHYRAEVHDIVLQLITRMDALCRQLLYPLDCGLERLHCTGKRDEMLTDHPHTSYERKKEVLKESKVSLSLEVETEGGRGRAKETTVYESGHTLREQL